MCPVARTRTVTTSVSVRLGVQSWACRCTSEKFWAWTDCDGHPEHVLTRGELLDNVTLHWLPGHWSLVRPPVPGELPRARRDEHPRAGPLPHLPAGRSFPLRGAEWHRFTDLRHYHQLERGGHFAAFEQPEAFVRDVRAFFRHVR
jgi:pimeloyl-ACP methyl ester carboxylesterase